MGKILRLDVSGAGPYTIPASNPFANGANARAEIWALGLRNPWRFSFDRATHHLWIADVGQDVWEEINLQNTSSAGGENYGWRCYEGSHSFNTNGCGAAANYTSPVYEYSHNATAGCSITGGYVYRGQAYPSLAGYYYYADYCNGVIYSLTTDGSFTSNVAGSFSGKFFSTFGENNMGELFVGDHSSGTVYKVTGNPSGVEDVFAKYNIQLFPMPCNGSFNCSIKLDKNQLVDLELSDITGKIILSKSQIYAQGDNIIPVDVSALAAGLYQLTLKIDNNIVTRKVMVQAE